MWLWVVFVFGSYLENAILTTSPPYKMSLPDKTSILTTRPSWKNVHPEKMSILTKHTFLTKRLLTFSQHKSWALKHVPKICPKYAQDMPKICQRRTRDIPQLRFRYAQDMSKICPRYARDMPKICTRYAKDMPKICSRYAQDMPRIPSSYGQDMPSNPLIHGRITDICDIIIYKRGPLSVTDTMRGSPERDGHWNQAPKGTPLEEG